MNKREFLKALEKRLKNLPKKEIQKSLAFYSEIIDDRMEEGDSEAEAVKNLGTPDEVAREILSDASFSTIVRGSAERIRTKSGGNTLFVVLAIIGFPIWFPLLVTAAVLLLSGAIVLAALWIVLFAVLAVLLFSSLVGVVGAVVHFFAGETAVAVVVLGLSVTVFAAPMLLAPLAKRALRFLWTTAGKWLKGIKKMFVNRREERE